MRAHAAGSAAPRVLLFIGRGAPLGAYARPRHLRPSTAHNVARRPSCVRVHHTQLEKAVGDPQGEEFTMRLAEEMGYLSDFNVFSTMMKAGVSDADAVEDDDDDHVEEAEVEDDENGFILSTPNQSILLY